MTYESLNRKDIERSYSGLAMVHSLKVAGGTGENDENPLPP
jgi:hypothetical protein